MSIIPSEEFERIKQTLRDWWIVAAFATSTSL